MKRRDALLVIVACAARFVTPVSAADAPPAEITAPVRAFYAALLRAQTDLYVHLSTRTGWQPAGETSGQVRITVATAP